MANSNTKAKTFKFKSTARATAATFSNPGITSQEWKEDEEVGHIDGNQDVKMKLSDNCQNNANTIMDDKNNCDNINSDETPLYIIDIFRTETLYPIQNARAS